MDFQPLELDVPRIVGPFRIIRTLGQGGTSVVYLGERIEHFSQQVAIKFLNLIPSADEEAAGRASEGQILTALDHPDIVRLLDRGKTQNGLRYIVMEFVEGIPLDEYCDENRLALNARIRLLVQVLDAIAYAHRRFVIHADLKPSNILVTGEGQLKLLDFGIAAMSNQKWQQADSARPASFQFTPAFASPEQRRGEQITPASDTYSMAIVSGILLTGVPPAAVAGSVSPLRTLQNFDRDSQLAIAALRATSPTALLDALDGDLESILAKGLRVEPDKRYRSADEFADDLTAFLKHRPVSARHGSRMYKVRKWTRRHRLAASASALFLLVAGLSVIGVVLQTGHAAHQRSVAQAGLHDLVRLTGLLDGDLYSSVQSLPQGDKAREVLLQGANTTLEKLAKNSGQDTVLEIELAKQYETLAKLHLGAGAFGKDKHRREAISDLDRAEALLEKIPATDPVAVDMRQQMLSLRQAASGK